MYSLEPWWYPILFLSGLAAGFVDSVAGGGGLITVPVLLQTGMPPQLALGTNKLQATFGSGSATLHFFRAGLIDWRAVRMGVLWTFLGASLGTLLVQRLDPGFLRQSIPWLLGLIAVYTLFQPKLGEKDGRAVMSGGLFYLVCGLGLGFYDGFFGPGTGSFWAMAHVLLVGAGLQKATANTKLMNFTSNVASLLIFLWAGQTLFAAGICMGAAQFIGARLGSGLVIRHGAKWVRPMLIAVTLALTARLIWLNFSVSR